MTSADNMLLMDRRKEAHLLYERLQMYKGTGALLFSVCPLSHSLGRYLSQELQLSLQIVPCKKITDPSNRNRSIGSVSAEDIVLRDHDESLPQNYLYHQIGSLRQNILRELWSHYKSYDQSFTVDNKVAIVISEGVVAGDAMVASLKSIRRRNPAKIVVALSSASREAAKEIAAFADEVIVISWDKESIFDAPLIVRPDHPVDQYAGV